MRYGIWQKQQTAIIIIIIESNIMQNAEHTRDSSLCTVLGALRQFLFDLFDQRLRYAFLRRADGDPVHLRMLASAFAFD